MFNAAIKYTILTLLTLSLATSCSGNGDEAKARNLLECAREALKAGDYERALTLTDSLKRTYPKEIDTRREAMHVTATANERLSLRMLETADSTLAVLGVRGDSLSRLVKFVSNPIEGYYAGASAKTADFAATTGIQARVSPGGDFYIVSSLPSSKGVKSTSVKVSCEGESASTASVPFDGERNDRSLGTEMITFMGVECEDLGSFISDFRHKPLTLSFVGERTLSVPLSPSAAEEIATLYEYANTIRQAKVAAIEKERLTRAVDIARSQAARTFVEKDSL